jgi:Fic family protein
MRTYQETHPWISFELDLRKAPHTLWLKLGEAQSKIEHLAGVPLLPETEESLRQLFLAKGVQATTAIEGNTLSEEEVLAHIQGRLELPPSKEYLKQEIDNIIKACDLIGARVLDDGVLRLRVPDIREYNKLVLAGLPLGEAVVPGSFRGHPVGVGRYRGAPAEDLEHLIGRLCDWLNNEFVSPGDEHRIAFGVLRAILAHLYLAWIHPFGDGNGRTARLIELQILLSTGVPSIAAHLLSNHYNQTRSEYYRHLDISHQAGDGALSFIEYALGGFIDGLKEQILTIRDQQLAVLWVNHIHDLFRNKDSASSIRRRRLAIDLSRHAEPLPLANVRHVSARIAEAFAGKTDRTVTRDLGRLEELGLIEITPRGARARREKMLAFLPAVRREG